jgi:hypothetical protein
VHLAHTSNRRYFHRRTCQPETHLRTSAPRWPYCTMEPSTISSFCCFQQMPWIRTGHTCRTTRQERLRELMNQKQAPCSPSAYLSRGGQRKGYKYMVAVGHTKTHNECRGYVLPLSGQTSCPSSSCCKTGGRTRELTTTLKNKERNRSEMRLEWGLIVMVSGTNQ